MLSQTNIKQRVLLNSFSHLILTMSMALILYEKHQGMMLSSIEMFKKNIFTGLGLKCTDMNVKMKNISFN